MIVGSQSLVGYADRKEDVCSRFWNRRRARLFDFEDEDDDEHDIPRAQHLASASLVSGWLSSNSNDMNSLTTDNCPLERKR
jgi:hypothetical protein